MSDAAALVPPARGADFTVALAVPPLDNLRRIGGEMFAWTDHDPQRGAVLLHLITGHAGPGRTVLVAGPHADDLVAALVDGGAKVTWLLRSLGDAQRVAAAHPAVAVLAGAAGKLDPAERFDLVVAADGVHRLNSVEGEPATAAELLDRLAAAVRPGGVLILLHDNHLGIHHTVRLEPGARERADAAWYPVDDHDTQRPASAEQLAARLAGSGLVAETTYAVFPEPSAPTVLIGPGLLGNVSSPLRPRLGTVLSQAFAAAYRGRPVLSDPRRLMRRALRAGAENAVAPAWLVIARAGVPVRGGHQLLAGDVRGVFAYEMKVVRSAVRTSVVSPLAGPVQREGLRRIAEPPATGADAGYVLEERLLHLAATADLRRMRVELAEFDTWLTGQTTDGLVGGPVALAGPADVFVTADGPELLPTRWEPIEPVPLAVVRVRVFWQFAVQLITSGQPHPWPVTAGAVELTAILLGMVGRAAGDAEVRAAVELQLRCETADHELTLDEQQARRLELLAVAPGTAGVDIPGYRELAEALWRQRYQASHLLAMMEWTEQMIQSRDNALSKLDQQIQFYRAGPLGKAIMAVRAAYRIARRHGGRLLRGRRGAAGA